jgi:polyether ionophore transport system permease protein
MLPDTGVVAARTTRRATRSGAAWGAVFAVYVADSALLYSTTYPTAASRAKFANSLAGNSGLAAMFGVAHHIDTVAGFTGWRTMGFLTLLGAVWGLLLATRLTRGEEDEGRWELLLSGLTTRGRAAAQAAGGVGAGLGTAWVIVAVGAVLAGRSGKVGFSVGSSLYLATSLVVGAALFAAVGLLCAQLAATRRQANGIGAAVLGAAFLLRMVADSGSGLTWLRWTTPLGWAEDLRPLTGSHPVAFVPVAGWVAASTAGAVLVASRRDLGASVIADRDSPPARTGLLRGPTGLTVRLTRGVAVGWTAGMAVLGLVLGLVAQSASSAISGSATIEKAVARLGGHRGGAATYLGITFLIAAALVAFAAAGQVAATRNEESAGYVDHLLVRPLARWRWMASRLAVAASLVVVASVIGALAAWVGATTQHSHLGLGSLTQAGINIAPPALFVLGAGFLLYGLVPRLAPAATYAFVAWSLLIEMLGSVVKSNRLLLDSSVLSHITPAPAANPDWTAAAWLTGLGLAAAVVGIVAFDRRDLAGA